MPTRSGQAWPRSFCLASWHPAERQPLPPNSIPIKLLIPIREVSCRCSRSSHRSPIYRPRMHSSTDAILPSRSGVLCERIHLLVEPDVLHAPSGEDAIDHDCQAFDIGALTGAAAPVENDRPHIVVGQLALDRP